jgi:hypothetical protein
MKPFILLSVGLVLQAAPAMAQTMRVGPMVELGGGIESPLSHGAPVNVLLRVAGGIGLGGSPCNALDVACMPRNSQIVLATIEGTAAYNPSGVGDPLPYLNIRFTPVSIPTGPQTTVITQEGWGRYGVDVGFHVNILPARLQRDVRVNREADVWATAIGIEGGVQAFPEPFFGFFVQAAADMLGYRYIRQNDLMAGGPNLHGFQAARARVEAGLIFLLDSAVSIRVSGGADGSVAVGGRSSGAYAILDAELFARLSVSITRFVEVFFQVGTQQRALMGDAIGGTDHRGVDQVMTGLSVRFD